MIGSTPERGAFAKTGMKAALLVVAGLFVGNLSARAPQGVNRPNLKHFDSISQKTWNVLWRVDKYGVDTNRSIFPSPYKTVYVHDNLLCTAGITRLENLLIGTGSTQAYDATHTRIGVGNGVGTAAAADTDLSAAAGSANRWFQLVDQTSTVSTNVLTVHATLATGDGNFVWNEFGVDQGTASGNAVTAPLLNHKTSAALGTKTTGSWAITLTITIT